MKLRLNFLCRFFVLLLVCGIADAATLTIVGRTHPWLIPSSRIQEANPTHNFAGARQVVVGLSSAPAAARGIIAPNLYQIPFGSTINSAVLSKYAINTTANPPELVAMSIDVPFVLGAVDSGVTTFGCSWGDPGFGASAPRNFDEVVLPAADWTDGGTVGAIKVAAVTANPTGQRTEFNVTTIIQAMVNRTAYGICIADTTVVAATNETTTWPTHNYVVDKNLRDSLIIDYTPPARTYSQDSIAFNIPDGWLYGRAIKVDGTNRDPQANYQTRIWINTTMLDTSKMEEFGQDIRILDENGTTVLNHFIPLDKWFTNGADSALIVVKAPDLAANVDTLFMIYGYNPAVFPITAKLGNISDCHVGATQGDKQGFIAMDAAEVFKERMNNEFLPNLVTNSGDLPNDTEDLAVDSVYLDSLGDIMAELDALDVYGLGNHDNNYTGMLAMCKRLFGLTYDDTSGAVPNAPGHYFICMNGNASTTLGTTNGDFSAGQLTWLDSVLTSFPAGSFVYFMTHQILDAMCSGHDLLDLCQYFTSDEADGWNVDYVAVESIFQSSNCRIIVYQGHLHWLNQNSVENVVYFTVPSMAEDGIGAWTETTVYGNRFVTFVTRTADTVWQVKTWDWADSNWVDLDRDVYNFADDVNGDVGQLKESWTGFTDGTFTINGLGRLKSVGENATSGKDGHSMLLANNYVPQDSFIVSAEFQLVTPIGTDVSYLGFALGASDSSNEFYLVKDRNSGGVNSSIRWKQWQNATFVTTVIIPVDTLFWDENWHTMKLVKTGDYPDQIYRFYMDDMLWFAGDPSWYTIGASLSMTDDTLGLFHFDNQTINTDNIRVRSYLGVEPTITVMDEYDEPEATQNPQGGFAGQFRNDWSNWIRGRFR